MAWCASMFWKRVRMPVSFNRAGLCIKPEEERKSVHMGRRVMYREAVHEAAAAPLP